MAAPATYIAFDLGAESGRAAVVRFEGSRLHLEEVHRFGNRPVQILGHLHWDALRLFDEIKRGLGLAAHQTNGAAAGIGLTTWGVDSALLDREGDLLGAPYCYRDPRTQGVMEQVFQRIPRADIFRRTGIQFMPLNTLYQLYATAALKPLWLDVADTLLMMPDLFNYWLTGYKGCEMTDASTTQFFEARERTWSHTIFKRLSLPVRLLPPIHAPGTVLGPLLPDVAAEVGLADVPVIAPACHDTASAVAAVPASDERSVFLSSGTWSALGAEVDEPVITDDSLRDNFTNECGAGGKTMFRKNIMGLWILQECRRTWAEAGQSYDYADLTRLAEGSAPFPAVIEPDHESFLAPGDMPARIHAFCQQTQQATPAGAAAMTRCILESLALKYRWVLDRLEQALGWQARVIHVVGGGSRNALLCQLTANATGRPVLAGPAEATTLGNALMQAVGLGHLASLAEGRAAVRAAVPLTGYEPQERARWEEQVARFNRLKEQTTTLL